MPSALQSIRTWKTLREPVSSADSAVNLKPGEEVEANTISTQASVIGIRAFGKDAANEVADLEFIGRMDKDGKAGGGPGQSLWQGTLTLGTLSHSSTIPLADGRWGAAATWLEVDLFTAAHNAAGAVQLTAGANTSNMLILPTYGYNRIQTVFATTFNVAAIGLLWRELSFGDVLQVTQEV